MMNLTVNAVAARTNEHGIDATHSHVSPPSAGIASLGTTPFEAMLHGLQSSADPIAAHSPLDTVRDTSADAYESGSNEVAQGSALFDDLTKVLSQPHADPIRPQSERDVMVGGWLDALAAALNRPQPAPIAPDSERDLMVAQPQATEDRLVGGQGDELYASTVNRLTRQS
jgi:hypothetical protein